MKMFWKIIPLFSCISISLGCDCRLSKVQWIPLEHGSLAFNGSLAISENCNSAIISISTANGLGKITSGQVAAVLEHNGMAMPYNDPNGCQPVEEKEEDEEDSTVVKHTTYQMCSRMHEQKFQLELSLNDGDKQLLQALDGDFHINFCINQINNIPEEKTCNELKGLITCTFEE